MRDFTSLERSVFEAICDARPDGAILHAALAGARVLGRINDGHGFYTSFGVMLGMPAVPIRPEDDPLVWAEMEGPGGRA